MALTDGRMKRSYSFFSIVLRENAEVSSIAGTENVHLYFGTGVSPVSFNISVLKIHGSDNWPKINRGLSKPLRTP
jgi:hypothetical protein